MRTSITGPYFAIHYGTAGTPVQVTLRGDEADVTLEVRNSGPAIDRETLASLFDPLTRARDRSSMTAPTETSAWVCTSRMKLPKAMVATSAHDRTRRRQFSRCACLAGANADHRSTSAACSWGAQVQRPLSAQVATARFWPGPSVRDRARQQSFGVTTRSDGRCCQQARRKSSPGPQAVSRLLCRKLPFSPNGGPDIQAAARSIGETLKRWFGWGDR